VLFYLQPYYILPVIILCISFVSCTCWVPTIGVLNLAIFPCYSNLLLRRRRWTRILWWGVLGCALPRLLSMWCYGVFRYSVSFCKRVALVFRDIIYVTNIIYSWHLVVCEHFWFVCVEQLILGTHAMSTWFWHKNWVWQKWYQSCVNHRNVCLDRIVISIVLF
jgi:hypothetical protein